MHKYTIIDELKNETIEVATANDLGILIATFVREIEQARDVNNDLPKMFCFCGEEYDSDDSIYNLLVQLSKSLYGNTGAMAISRCDYDTDSARVLYLN